MKTALKQLVESYTAELKELKEKTKRIESAIKVLQDTCSHDPVDIGHDSHRTIYQCSICKKQFSE